MKNILSLAALAAAAFLLVGKRSDPTSLDIFSLSDEQIRETPPLPTGDYAPGSLLQRNKGDELSLQWADDVLRIGGLGGPIAGTWSIQNRDLFRGDIGPGLSHPSSLADLLNEYAAQGVPYDAPIALGTSPYPAGQLMFTPAADLRSFLGGYYEYVTV